MNLRPQPRRPRRSLAPGLLLCQALVVGTLSLSFDRPLDRRRALGRGILVASSGFVASSTRPSGSWAASPPPVSSSSNTDLAVGLLETRVSENLQSPPPYGLEAPDVQYPLFLAGTWQVTSTTTDILAPCGVAFFGGNTTYARALQERGTSLQYSSRFVPILDDQDSPSYCVADRAYNIQRLAQAALGANSVVHMDLATPDQFSGILAPPAAPSLLRVDMLTLRRRQEGVSETRFDCAEVVREIVAPIDANGRVTTTTRRNDNTTPSTIRKEVETISIYTYWPDRGEVTCRQRSAAFLVPSQEDPLALALWQATRGRPVDVRYYDLVYRNNGKVGVS